MIHREGAKSAKILKVFLGDLRALGGLKIFIT